MSRKQHSAARTTRLMLETLEDRLCPSSYTMPLAAPFNTTSGLQFHVQKGQDIHFQGTITANGTVTNPQGWGITFKSDTPKSAGGLKQFCAINRPFDFHYVAKKDNEIFTTTPAHPGSPGVETGNLTVTAADNLSVMDLLDPTMNQTLHEAGFEYFRILPHDPFQDTFDLTGSGTVTAKLDTANCPAGAELHGVTTVNMSEGEARFESLTVDLPGAYRVIFTSGDGTTAVKSFTVQPQDLTQRSGIWQRTLDDVGRYVSWDPDQDPILALNRDLPEHDLGSLLPGRLVQIDVNVGYDKDISYTGVQNETHGVVLTSTGGFRGECSTKGTYSDWVTGTQTYNECQFDVTVQQLGERFYIDNLVPSDYYLSSVRGSVTITALEQPRLPQNWIVDPEGTRRVGHSEITGTAGQPLQHRQENWVYDVVNPPRLDGWYPPKGIYVTGTPGKEVNVTLGKNAGSAHLLGTTTATINQSGWALLSGLAVDTPGTGYTLVAKYADGSGQAGVSVPFDVAPAAQTLTWSGGGDGVNWGDADNWAEHQLPSNGATLVFPETNHKTTNDNITTPLAIKAIDIRAGGYNFTSDPNCSIQLDGSITSVGDDTFAIPTRLIAAAPGADMFDVNSGTLKVTAPLAGTGKLELRGFGTIDLSGTASWTGGTTLWGGTIIVHGDNPFSTCPLEIYDPAIKSASDSRVNLVNRVTLKGAGTLHIGKGLTFQGDVNIAVQTTLRFDGDGSLDFTGLLHGTGQLDILGGKDDVLELHGTTSAQLFLGSTSGDAADSTFSTILDGVLTATTGSVTVRYKAWLYLDSTDLLTGTHALEGGGSIVIDGGQVFAGAGHGQFTGSITLGAEHGGNLTIARGAEADPLGKGMLELDGGQLDNDASATISNLVRIGGSVLVHPNEGTTLVFGNDVTMIKSSKLTLTGSGEVDFAANHKLSGLDLTLSGGLGRVGLYGKIACRVQAGGPESASLIVFMTGKLMDTSALVVAENATVVLDRKDNAGNSYALFGKGTISVPGGRLISHGDLKNYEGQITLNGGEIVLDPSDSVTMPLGIGDLRLAGGLLTALRAVSLRNAVYLEGSTTLGISFGLLIFSRNFTVSNGAGLVVSGIGAQTQPVVKFQSNLLGSLKVAGIGSRVLVHEHDFAHVLPGPGVTVTTFR